MQDMFIAGEWLSGAEELEVRSPFSGDVIETVPTATLADVEVAVGAAVEGARAMAALPAHERAEILDRFADIVEANVDELALTITRESGKPLSEARAEANRTHPLLRLCAGEALRLTGEVLPMDATDIGVGRLGLTLIEPCGVVAAITPFNFPARLVALKLGPALAAGNSVVTKPASATPLSALLLTRYALEAGVPPLAIQCFCGPGSTVGNALCADDRVRLITFTGSHGVATEITRVAGPKRMTLELGSNAAVVVLDDADVPGSAVASARDGYVNAGQVCIAAQRIIVDRSRRDDYLGSLLELVDLIQPGDPLEQATTLGPVISESEAGRILGSINDAREQGANVIRGGGRDGTLIEPTVVVNPPLDSTIWRDELFGPAIAVHFVDSTEDALRVANGTRYGLAASVFTRDIDKAIHFARNVRSGVVHVNHGPNWRTDVMPYGGFGDSGYGKEGVKYSIAEMTEVKTVVVHPAGQP